MLDKQVEKRNGNHIKLSRFLIGNYKIGFPYKNYTITVNGTGTNSFMVISFEIWFESDKNYNLNAYLRKSHMIKLKGEGGKEIDFSNSIYHDKIRIFSNNDSFAHSFFN